MSFVNGLANSGLSDGIAGAATNYNATSDAVKQVTANMGNFKDPGIPAFSMPEMTPEQIAAAAPGGGTGFSDPNHPAWGVLSSMVGAGGAPAPSPIQPQQLEKGGEVDNGSGTMIHRTTLPEKLVQGAKDLGAAVFGSGAGARAAAASKDAVSGVQQKVDGMQNGGVVRLNHGIPVNQPAFTNGPAMPNQGIVPASTEGEILTMDAGGMVPDGFIPVGGQGAPPMTGRAAGISAGLGAGMTMGRNLRQAWEEHQAREAAGENAYNTNMIGQTPPADDNSPAGLLGKARDSVEAFFHHLHEHTLDNNNKPNGPQGVPATPADAAGPTGTPALPAPPQPAGAGAAGPGPAGGTPGPAPVPGTPAAGGPPPPGASAAGGPPPPGASAAGGPPPPGASAAGGPPPPGASPAGAASPAGSPGAPQPSPIQAAVTKDALSVAAQDPQIKSGQPDKTPAQSGLPHSLTPDWYEHSQYLIAKAARAAALAGEDPAKVTESMTAMRTAHIQGQVFRQGSAAYEAVKNGDQDALKQALSNINYYLPNGQGMKFSKDASGALTFRNPFFGMQGDKNPEWMPANEMTISQIVQDAANPATVGDALLKTYQAQREAQNKATTAAGEFMTGQGRQQMGAAAYIKATIAQQNSDATRRLLIANGDRAEAEAGKFDRSPMQGGGLKISQATYQNLQTQGINYVDKLVQGQPTTAPTMIPRVDPSTGKPMMGADGKPMMAPNLSPGAGKSLPDGTRIPTSFQNLTPDQQEETKKNTATILASNFGVPGMNVAKAADLGARIARQEANQTTHMDPETHKPAKDFIFDSKLGVAHIWVGNGYESVHMYPNVAEEGQQAIPTGSGGGGDSGESGNDDMSNNMG